MIIESCWVLGFVCVSFFLPPLSQQEVVFYLLLPPVKVTTSVQFFWVMQAVRAVPRASPGTQGTRVAKAGGDGQWLPSGGRCTDHVYRSQQASDSLHSQKSESLIWCPEEKVNTWE